MSEIDQIKAVLVRIEAKIDALTGRPQPHLTRKAFAKLAGISAKTVSRKIRAREILTQKGRIPRTELAKFTS